jgi:acetyl esterase/lipase
VLVTVWRKVDGIVKNRGVSCVRVHVLAKAREFLMRCGLISMVAVVLACPGVSQDRGVLRQGTIVHLWPESVLAAAGGQSEEKSATEGGVTRISNVTDPTLTVYQHKGITNSDAAVIICPGGGYSTLAWDKEGTEVAAWLNSLGVTGIVLKYRVPGKRDLALQDGQRAVSIVRCRAAEFKIDPARIGILGFSSGGHLAVRVSTNFLARSYAAVDKCDEASCRPDFSIPIYPAYLTADEKSPFDAAALPVSAETPPTFMAVAFGDRFVYGALQFELELKKAGVPSELHIFQFGGHGGGLRKTEANLTTWPEICERWLRGIKVLARQ